MFGHDILPMQKKTTATTTHVYAPIKRCAILKTNFMFHFTKSFINQIECNVAVKMAFQSNDH